LFLFDKKITPFFLIDDAKGIRHNFATSRQKQEDHHEKDLRTEACRSAEKMVAD
jgi:hypothetical protein